MTDKKNLLAVETMSRKDFFENIVRGFAKTELFSKLVCLGVDSLTEDEKSEMRTTMNEAGIPMNDIKSDLKLAIVAQKITARSVALA